MNKIIPFNFCRTSKLRRPNIILIMADDLGYECLSCNGSLSYRTPNIDKLADTGVRFEHCYSTPLCTPSRVQIMTGKYNFRNYTEFGNLKPGEITFGNLLKNSGYKTCAAGKWQLVGHYEGSNYKGIGTLPEDAGFEEYCLWQVDRLGSRYWNPLIKQNGKYLFNTENKYGPDVFCEYIIQFIERNRTNPFFVYYPMVLTHSPFNPTPDSNYSPEEKNKSNTKYFTDMVEYMDKIVGRIVNNIDDLGIRENTLIIFTGDNGSPRQIKSEMPGKTINGGKGNTINTGIHVPLIINRKGTTPSGIVCEDLIDFSDFLPTFIEAANLKWDKDLILDGRSFLPQIKGDKGSPREWIFCHYDPKWGRWEKKRFAMNREWKLYENGNFYDLINDSLEENPILLENTPFEAVNARKMLQNVLDSMK